MNEGALFGRLIWFLPVGVPKVILVEGVAGSRVEPFFVCEDWVGCLGCGWGGEQHLLILSVTRKSYFSLLHRARSEIGGFQHAFKK